MENLQRNKLVKLINVILFLKSFLLLIYLYYFMKSLSRFNLIQNFI